MHRKSGPEVLKRHQVTVSGKESGQPIVFGHGFGTDQSMWRFLTPAFADTFRIVVFDSVGHGRAAVDNRAADRYGTPSAYADDLLQICQGLDLRNVIFVGHSVSGIIGVLAANLAPDRFAGLVLIGSSPRYLNDAGYVGGYTLEDITDILETIDSNFVSWSRLAGPASIGDHGRGEPTPSCALGPVEGVVDSLVRTDERIVRQFARATFLSDHRADLAVTRTPTLVLHCSGDTLVPRSVGEYVAHEIPGGRFELIASTGHFPHLSASDHTTDAIRRFLPTVSSTAP
jgi:sigma-B regulation protein RsbQ